MKVFVATSIIGVFAFDEKGTMVHYNLFPPRPELIAERLEKVKNGDLIPEEETLLNDLIKSGYKQVAWDKKIDFPGITCMYEPDNLGAKTLQRDFRRLALDLRWVESQQELNQLMTTVNIMLTKKELRKPKKDRILMHAVGVVDELDRTINTLSERMREWYGLYYPEATRLINTHDQLARIICEEGEREKIKHKNLEKYSKISAGMPFSDSDLKAVQEYSGTILQLSKAREYVAEYIRTESKDIMPNLAAVAGPLIACRLVALAGSMEKLAKMSSSTIQLLGAEKALFRHLRGEGRAPKFGVIFAHPSVQNAPRDERGKVARVLAAKLTMAARADFYTGKNISDQLLKDMKSKVDGERKRGIRKAEKTRNEREAGRGKALNRSRAGSMGHPVRHA